MTTITLATLRAIGSGPTNRKTSMDACLALGGLAAWWLTDEALRPARESGDPELAWLAERPTPPAVRGACWIACRVREGFARLRPAVALPLRWARGEGHSPALPDSLRRLADQAKRQVAASKALALSPEGWWLGPAPSLRLERLDDDVFETVGSGWAAVTAGLVAALQGLDPVPTAWASAAWDERAGPVRVEGLAEKMRLAAEWGATSFAVAVSQRGEAEDWAAREGVPMEVVSLPAAAEAEAWASLKGYVSRFVARPDAPASADDEEGFARCRQYYVDLPAFEQDSGFYATHLAEVIAQRCRRKVEAKYPSARPTHLATIVSKSPELAVLAARATGVKKCLLLHTPDLAEEARRSKSQLEPEIEVRLRPFAIGPEMLREIRVEVADFVEGVPDDGVVIDIKPGDKKMTHAMTLAARRGNWVYFLGAEMLKDRRNGPGTEEPELWQA